MSYDYIQDCVIYILSTVVYLALAADSLRYHVTKYHSTREQILALLEGLPKPLKLFFSPNPYGDIYLKGKSVDLSTYLIKEKHQYFTRILFGVMPFSIISVIIAEFLRAQNGLRFMFLTMFLTIHGLCFYKAWLFGRDLKGIEVSRSGSRKTHSEN